jgi:DNA mismatch repair protein MutS2
VGERPAGLTLPGKPAPAVDYIMSRRRKHRHEYGRAASALPEPPGIAPTPASNGAAGPAGDVTAELVGLRAQIEEVRHELNARLDALAQAVERLLPACEPPAAVPERSTVGPVSVGEEVYVPTLGGTYTVVEVSPSGRTFKVQAGVMRVQVRQDEVWALDGETPVPSTGAGQEPVPGARPELSAHIPEIDLHGFSERDALVTLELFLHHAYTQRTPRVRVIHGKGDGILRAAVRRALAHSPLVRAIDAGPHFRGDDGVTLAELDL